MKTSEKRLRFNQSVIALAVLAALGQAQAQEAPAPQSSVSVGGLFVSGDEKDRARFGLYNGLREDSGYGLFDFLYSNRDAASGMWTSFEGRNLFLDTREVNFTARKLGDWKLSADYSELVRYSPYTINTGMTGAGSTAPNPVRLSAPGTGGEVNLDTQRKSISLGGSTWFGGALQFEASLKSEEKEGARAFGRGFACSATWVSAGSCTTSSTQWQLLFLPEPIDSTINQAEAKFTYAADGLLVTAGYYGSIYKNRNSNISNTAPATQNNPLGVATPVDAGLRTTMALPLALNPDNEAHQFYLQGSYRFSPTTVANFKYAYTVATQDEDFAAMGFFQAPAGRTNAGAEMKTTLAQAGITSRPMPKLSLLANVRYEKKDDNTPVALYNVEGGPTTAFTNSPANKERMTTKLEGSYLFPGNYRATVGLDWESVDHGEFTPTSSVAGLSGLRQKTKEEGYRLELRKSVSDSITGFLQYQYSKREGDSPWLKPLSLSQGRGVIEANDDPACVPPAAPAINNCIYNRTGIFPFVFEDRKRDKIKAMATWVPSDELSLQFLVEDGKDKFSGPTEHGLRETSFNIFSVDAAYRMSDNWSLTAYASRGNQQSLSGHSTGYDGDVKDTNTAFGLGLKGKASEKLLITADVTYLNDDLKYKQEMDANASAANVALLAATGGLPDVSYKLWRIKLTGDYTLDKKSMIRVVLGYERSDFNEWTWQWNGNSFLYSDGTTVGAQEKQSVTFVGATYTYRW
jgi:MtrB/PioB family decaheme-associated outer membrane protein